MNRIKQHIEGKGAKYLRSNKVKKVYYVEKYLSQPKAMRREREIKKLTHKDKKKLIEKPFDQEFVDNVNQFLGLS
jgi:putative endonuclease